ncbi:MAG TPA: Eco57I restriction-modification methylase domain-containing protein [Candidatus Cloacimonadota bacterium]|nr:Eco57I restriction-modification methylase domain-containing protein [Candidatus Cloacimonadota bacterium]
MELNQNIVTPANFSPENWIAYFDTSSDKYSQNRVRLRRHIDVDFPSVYTLGALEFEDGTACGLFLLQVGRSLTERSSRRKQFDKATDIIRQESVQAGIFIFHDVTHSFRLSLVYPVYKGTKRTFSNYRRHSFYVSGDLSNKTYLLQLSKHKLNSMGDLKDIFSVEKVSALFYEEFEKEYARLKTGIKNTFNKDITDSLRADFALLFVIRIIFLGFVQKKGWLGKNAGFIRDYLASYDMKTHKQGIYQDLLTPLFFNALNSAPSSKNKHGFPSIREPFKSHLVSAPYLNGGLFRRHEDYDKAALYITDKAVSDFVTFLFSFNFTLEENTLYDEELELNPEFLGIIFEKLVNKEHGAIYTPRLEVDFMCRLSLVKYLQQNCLASISLENLYKLFFPEYGSEDDQTPGEFTNAEAQDLLDKLETVTVCDPAIGSGAFAVGMLNVIDEIECSIHQHFLPDKTDSSPYERKKRIIFRSLYGVEVKQWAVWITQLRLWITLLIEADDSLQSSDEPLLPSFDFKIRQGDSLIQMLGSTLFPVSGEGVIGPDTKRRIDDLMKLKKDYFFNRCPQKLHEIELKHKALYTSILDSKKKDLLKKLSKLRAVATPEVQDDIFGTDIQAEIELESGRQKRQIKELELQIWKVDQEISQINTKNLPFVWRIDFPEIFIEKGGFDIVIGNPPYVAQEEIEDPLGNIRDNKKYKELLRQMAHDDFPQDIPSGAISGKSDLYTFFYIRGLRLLNDNGILTFICSNSWLDVEFGAWLQKFLLERCPIHFIIDNLAKRVFRDAGINTIISVIGARRKMVRADDLIRFAAFKLPFENSLYTENFLTIEESTNSIDYDDLRINPVSREQLIQEGWENSKENKYAGSMWGGFYLRAPNILTTILDKCKTKLCNLNSLAAIKGYIHDNSLGNRYPKRRYVKSVKDISLLGIDIESNGVRDQGIKSSTMNDIVSPILFPRTLGSRHLVVRNLGDVYFKEFYKIIPHSTDMTDSVFAQLNSSFCIFQREILGLSNLGDGAIKFSIQSIGLFKIIPDLTNLDFDEVIEPLLSQPIDDIYIELTKSHRIELDDIVFSHLGLTKQERTTFMDLLYLSIDKRLSRANTKDSK